MKIKVAIELAIPDARSGDVHTLRGETLFENETPRRNPDALFLSARRSDAIADRFAAINRILRHRAAEGARRHRSEIADGKRVMRLCKRRRRFLDVHKINPVKRCRVILVLPQRDGAARCDWLT